MVWVNWFFNLKMVELVVEDVSHTWGWDQNLCLERKINNWRWGRNNVSVLYKFLNLLKQ